MGNYINKYFSHNNNEAYSIEDEKNEMKNLPPKAEFQEDVMQTPPSIQDPRSVTSGIYRTPIEVYNTPDRLNGRVISAIPKHLQHKPYLETDMDKIMLCLTPRKSVMSREERVKLQTSDMQSQNAETFLIPSVNVINEEKTIDAIDKECYNGLGLDPRSPAADFDRTPILMPKSLERMRSRTKENLQRCGSYDTDIFYPRFVYCEVPSEFNVTEIQASPDLAVDRIKQLHLDYIEHEEKSNASSPGSLSETDSLSETLKKITNIKGSELPKTILCIKSSNIVSTLSNERVRTLTETGAEDADEIPGTSKQDNNDDVFVEESADQNEPCGNVNDIIKIWRDSSLSDEFEQTRTSVTDNAQIIPKRLSHETKEEVIITFDDDSVSKDTLSLKLFKPEIDKTKLDTVGKKKKIFKSQDEKRILNCIENHLNENTKIRTPLANRSNNGQMQALLINSPQQIFRSKGITQKMLQENTPPHKKFVTNSKLNSTQWDLDSTTII